MFWSSTKKRLEKLEYSLQVFKDQLDLVERLNYKYVVKSIEYDNMIQYLLARKLILQYLDAEMIEYENSELAKLFNSQNKEEEYQNIKIYFDKELKNFDDVKNYYDLLNKKFNMILSKEYDKKKEYFNL